MLYLDTSMAVAALVGEAASSRVLDWFAAQDADDLAISDWVVTEFSAALARKLRADEIGGVRQAAALAAFARLASESFTVLAVSRMHYRTAARVADRHALRLRAGDALHLAVCADRGAILCTLDRRQAEAGTALGVPTMLL